MKYIAYGSNMVEAQMAYRCRSAKLVGTGYLHKSRLEFYLHATVESTRSEMDKVPVAVWEIDENDERSLDRYEGFPNYYIKKRQLVHMADGSQITGMLYVMKMIRVSPPTPTYYEGILNAYHCLGFSDQIKLLEEALDRSYKR